MRKHSAKQDRSQQYTKNNKTIGTYLKMCAIIEVEIR